MSQEIYIYKRYDFEADDAITLYLHLSSMD